MPIVYYTKDGKPIGSWENVKKHIKPEIMPKGSWTGQKKAAKVYTDIIEKLIEPITLKDLQGFFGVDENGKEEMTARKFQRLIQRGCLEATRIGRLTFLTNKQMDDWFDRHTVQPQEEFKVRCSYCEKLPQNQPGALKKERKERKELFVSNFPSLGSDAAQIWEKINDTEVIDFKGDEQ